MRAAFFSMAIFAAAASLTFGRPQPCAEIPLRYRDGLLWVRVATDRAAEPLNFLLDSGAAVSVLDDGTARRLGLKRTGQVAVRGVGTQTVGHWTELLAAH